MKEITTAPLIYKKNKNLHRHRCTSANLCRLHVRRPSTEPLLVVYGNSVVKWSRVMGKQHGFSDGIIYFHSIMCIFRVCPPAMPVCLKFATRRRPVLQDFPCSKTRDSIISRSILSPIVACVRPFHFEKQPRCVNVNVETIWTASSWRRRRTGVFRRAWRPSLISCRFSIPTG